MYKTKIMEVLNAIGLDTTKSEQIANRLNELLANYSVFYQNARGYHWNIKGEMFFVLHAKFEDLYTDLIEKIDEIAERILTLGYTPQHSYSDYNRVSVIKESDNTSDGHKAVADILQSLQTLINLQRLLLDQSSESGDEGTNALMSDYIREQEKSVWMFSAFLDK